MMNLFTRGAAVLALLSAVGTSAAGAAPALQACVPAPQAEALLLSVAPEALRKVAAICTPVLPASALLRRSPNPMIGRYAAESGPAWASARGALASVLGEGAAGLLDSELARPLLSQLVVGLIEKEVQAKDCGQVDRVLTLMEPLPPRNTAALVVTMVQLSQTSGSGSGITVCAHGAGR